MTSHSKPTTSEEEVDADEQELFGDNASAVEEPLVDVEIVPEQTAEI